MQANDFSSHETVIEAVRSEIIEEFRRKGERLLPINQGDIDGAVARVDVRLKTASHQARQHASQFLAKAKDTKAFLSQAQLPGLLLDALTANRKRKVGHHG